MAVVTVTLVTVGIVTSFSETTWHLNNWLDVLVAAFHDSRNVCFKYMIVFVLMKSMKMLSLIFNDKFVTLAASICYNANIDDK